MEKIIELSFKIYNSYCLKEFKREEWDIMSNNNLEYNDCSILENILYFLSTFEIPSSIYPDPNLSIEEQIEHLKNILIQYYTENRLHKDIEYIKNNNCILRKKDVLLLFEKLNIWVYIYNNCNESWTTPQSFLQEPRKVFFLYQTNEHSYYIMFPKKIEPSFKNMIEERPKNWEDYKSFLSISPKLVKFYQKVIKNYCFRTPSSKDWFFIPTEQGKNSILECILFYFYSMEQKPWDIPISSLSWKEQIIQLRKTIIHSYHLENKSVSINDIEHGYLKEEDILRLLNRNGIWVFTYLKNNFSPVQEGIWDIPSYQNIPKGILFLYKKNQDEYFLLSPRKEILDHMVKKTPSFYENIKNRYVEGEEITEEDIILMDTDNPYTGKKEVWNFSQHLLQFIKKNRFHHNEIKNYKYKSLLHSLHSIQNNLPNNLESDRESYKTALMNNNFRTKIQKIIEKFQEKYKHTWVYILYPNKDIDTFQTSKMNFPEHILFLFKRKNKHIESKHWNKKEFYFLEFNVVPEEFKSYIQEKSSSKEKSSSSSKDYNTLKVNELKSLCRERKIPLKSYVKNYLIEKLNQYDKKSSSIKESLPKKSSSSKEKSSSLYKEKTVNDLIKLCRERGIPLSSYKKEYIIERLEEFDKNPNMKIKKKKTKIDKLKKIFKKK